jgi:hypothetical protein
VRGRHAVAHHAECAGNVISDGGQPNGGTPTSGANSNSPSGFIAAHVCLYGIEQLRTAAAGIGFHNSVSPSTAAPARIVDRDAPIGHAPDPPH